ncbi:sugar ABC transporter substrate-binding protein [Paenibacillus sp. FSL H7-0326]|uniref:ABC transporter substrate-binding protein n=1 Tax=Paenibacillus sp. FSL H7-0326 TaxID=1921144 RepID=UPI00096E0CF3|nr:extracellular solute-binding protein [Paenibacillus sp. FSL H7-0326]OMC65614.1 sugar ABC transporter substrate-binding protein [Paenibacillus sp. FSL H7-0326]
MRKTWIMLTSILMFAVTACSGGGGSSEQSADAKDTVTVWTYPVHNKYEEDLKELLADFNKEHPNITVKTEMLTWAEGPKKFDVALNAGNPPDLYFHSVDGSYVDSGLAIQLDDYLTPEIKEDYYPGTLELGQIQGKQYGLPIYQYQWGWGGNKRILEEAGVDWQKIQQEGWTWDEFLELAPKLMGTAPDGSPQYAFVTEGQTMEIMELLSRNNNMPDVLNAEGEFQWNDDRILETLKFLETLRTEGYMPKETAAIAPAKRVEMFYAEQAAIISKAIPYYDVLIKQRNADIDAGTVQGAKVEFVLLPVPHHKDAPQKSTMGGEGYVAFRQKNDKGEQHAKNTFLVMEALSGAKAGNSANELVLPFVRNSQAEYFEGKGLGTPETLEAARIMAEHMEQPVVLSLDSALAAKQKQFKEQVMKPNIQALFTGEKTAEEIAAEFKAKGEEMFK